MTDKTRHARLPKTIIPAVALAVAMACASQAFAQGTGSGTGSGSAGLGTAGAANAGAANDSLGGGGPPTTTGTAPGSTSPGGINSAPEPGSPAPSARPNQVPSTAGTTNQSTPPPSGTVGMSGGRIPGHTGRVSNVQENADPVVQETEKEVSKRIKNICRGC